MRTVFSFVSYAEPLSNPMPNPWHYLCSCWKFTPVCTPQAIWRTGQSLKSLLPPESRVHWSLSVWNWRKCAESYCLHLWGLSKRDKCIKMNYPIVNIWNILLFCVIVASIICPIRKSTLNQYAREGSEGSLGCIVSLRPAWSEAYETLPRQELEW